MGYKFAPLVFSGLIPAGGGAASWKGAVDTEGDLPTVGNLDGDCAVVKATNTIYIWGSGKWNDTSLEEGSFGLASNPNAFAIITDDTDPLIRRLQIQITPADATNPGAVSTTAQTFAGDKTFNDDVIVEGSIDAKGGIDSSTNTLTIGANTANINIGGTGAIITISGNTTYEHVDNLLVKDQTITLNNGGSAGSGAGSGIEVEENGTVTASVYLSNDRASWNLVTPVPVGGGTATITPGIGIILDQSSHDPVTLGAVGSTPNLDGATLTNQVLNLEPADATNPGVVTTTAQTFAGDKTFNDNVAFVDVIDVQTGIDSTSGTLTLGGINTTTVNIGEPVTGVSSAVFYGVTDHSGYDITNFGQLSTTPTANQAVVATLTSSSPNPDYAGLTFTDSALEQADVFYTAGGTLNLNSSQNLALTAPNFNVDSANVDIGQLGGTTDLIGGTVTLDSADVNIGQSPGTTDIVGTVTIEYNPADPADWAPAPTHVIEAIDQLADRFVERDTVTKEPTGFPNRDDSAIFFDDGLREFTINVNSPATSFDYYVKGKKFTVTSAQSITLPNLPGDHYIYFNDAGVLSTTQVASGDLYQNNALISIVYWNTDTNTHTYFAEERHGLVMDGATHTYLHTVFGARYLSGLALQGFTIGTGGNNADAQFTADQGTIRDEDILIQIPTASEIPILYREGQQWRKKAVDPFPLIYSGTAGYVGASGRLPYNQYTGGAWQLTEVQNNKYVLVHFFGTNDIENGIVGIQGTAEYNSIETARTAANTEISSLSGLPFAEFVAIGSVLFQTSDTFGNTPKADVIPVDDADYVDFRGTQLYTPAGNATTHSLLSGLSADDHFQYLLANGTRAMSGALNMGTHQINNVVDPTSAQDAATKNYVDSTAGLYLPLAGGTMSGPIDMGLNAVQNAGSVAAAGSFFTATVLPNAIVQGESSVEFGGGTYPNKSSVNIYSAANGVFNGMGAARSETALESYNDINSQYGDLVINANETIFGSDKIYFGHSDWNTYTITNYGSLSKDGSDIKIEAVADLKLDAASQIKAMAELSMESAKIVNVTDPDDPQDAATKNYVDSKGYIGDINRTTFTALNNTSSPLPVDNLVFSNITVRGFNVILTIDRTSSYAEYNLRGIQKSGSWEMSQDYIGDDTGLAFSITSLGQIEYTSTDTSVDAILTFKAVTV